MTKHFTISIQASLIGLSLTVFSVAPRPLLAQSVDSCMNAQGEQAVSICSNMLDNGSRNANVFYRLASVLYQSGDSSTAQEIIAQGLQIHPGNDNLTRLKNYIEVGDTEQDRIEKSAEKNQTVFKLGKLKIICRTKDTRAGLQACRDYLSRTKVDKGLIEERLALLEKKFKPKPAPKPVPEPVPDTATDTEIVVTTAPPPTQPKPTPPKQQAPTPPAASDNNAVSDARTAYKVLVFDIQSSLQQLGFNTGTPDGIPGARTRDALTRFYQANSVPNNEFSQNGFISDSTLLDLVDATRNRQIAKRLLAESQVAEVQGNFPLALLKLNQAEETSPFIEARRGYRSELTDKILASRNPPVTPTPTPQPTPQPIPQPEAPTQKPADVPAPSGPIVVANDLTRLMDQIKRLEVKLISQERDLQRNLQAIDEVASEVPF